MKRQFGIAKHVVCTGMAALMAATALADTATTNGVTWTYSVKDGVAVLGGGTSSTPAIPKTTSGTVAIPSELGGVPVTTISAYAFSGCSAVTEFTIPNSVTNIGQYAFQYCSGLTTLEVPGSVEAIGSYAFSGCGNVRTMTLPFVGSKRGYTNTYEDDFGYVFGSTRYAGDASVRQHYYYKSGGSYYTTYTDYYIPTNLSSVIIADDTAIPAYAFENCWMLTNIVVNDEVKSLGSYAFSGCTGLKIHPIPGGAATIGSYVFQNCTGLASIDLPETVTRIADYAFSGCTRATALEIPNSVTNIGQYAFQNCSALTSVVVPESVQSIGYSAFGGCPNIRSATLPFVGSRRGNADGYGDNFGYVFGSGTSGNAYGSIRQSYYYNNGNSSSSGTYYIPTNLTSVVITDETVLRPYAFQNCWMLTNIVVNDEITSLGSYAFDGCSRLRNLPIPSGVSGIGSYAFQNCTRLPEIDLPATVARIGNYAFSGCSSATSLAIPNTVTNIGQYAFQNCTGLASVEVPGSVEAIGSYAFSGCGNVRTMTLPFVGSKRGYTNTYEDDFGYVFGSTRYAGDASVRQHYYYKSGGSYYTTYTDYYIPTNLSSVIIADDTAIPAYAFENCWMLTNIVVNDEVKSLGSYAFSGCTGLRAFTIPSSATSIGSYAFSGCSRLAEIVIPANVRSIGSYAFQNCTALASVRILSDSLSIDQYAFSGCPASIFDTTTVPGMKMLDGFVVSSDSTLSGVVDLSETKGIAADAFNGNTKITKVILPEGMKSIPSNAFYGCTALTSVEIPDSVTSIGSYAFYNCRNITSADLPDGLKTIGEWAFYNTSIRSLVIPEGVTSIGQYSFYNCTSLTSLALPASLTRIADYAFQSCNKLTSLVLPEGVKTLGNYAFAYCSSLQRVAIPTTLEQVGIYAFNNDTKLSRVDISDLAAWCGVEFGICDGRSNPLRYAHNLYLNGEQIVDLEVPDTLPEIPYGVFYGATSLKSVVFPGSVTNIGRASFAHASGITNIVFSEGLESIGLYAFDNAAEDEMPAGSAIERLVFPTTLRAIGDYAFRYNTSLVEAILPERLETIGAEAFLSCSLLEEIEIPDGIISIGNAAFQNCANLATLTLSESLETIGAYAFAGCRSLAAPELPSSLKSIGDYAFQNCAGFDEIEIPASVTSIGQYAFNSCANLTNVVVHSGLSSIGNSAFSGCKGLTVTLSDDIGTVPASLFRYCGGVANVFFPESVTNINDSAFYGCSLLTRLDLPVTLKRIGQYAFHNCSGLSEVVIPDGVTSIGQYAFANCTKLTRAVIPSSVKTIGQYAFSGCPKLDSIELAEGTTSIGGSAFRHCTGLKDIALPATVKSVGEYAFDGCTSLTNISFPDGLSSIGNYAFSNCRSLAELDIPSSAQRIGDYAFEGCNGLADLAIPDGVRSIGSHAFHACTNLFTLSVPASATNIGWYAFAACSNLAQVTLLTTPSRGIPTADLSLKDTDWSVVDGDTIQADSKKFESGMSQETTGKGVLSFEWKIPGYWYQYNNKDYFSTAGYLSVDVDYRDSYYSSSSLYSGWCETENYSPVAVSVSSDGRHTLGWYFWWDRYAIGEGTVNPATNFGGIRALSFVQSRTGGVDGVDGTVVGASAFDGCVSLERVEIADLGAWCGTIFENAWANPLRYAKRLFVGGEEVRNLVIPDTVGAVAGWAFADCGGITNVVVPEGVASIGTHAFQNIGIGDISLPSSVTNVGTFAFAGCDGVKTVSLTSNLKRINDYAFAGQTKVVSATLPSGTALSKYLPDSLATIREIAIADGETEIVANAFAGCAALESVAIPDTVAKIGQNAFNGCLRLTEVEIPASATNISFNAFDDCVKLREIAVDGDNPSYCSNDGVLFDERGTERALTRCPEGFAAKDYSIPDGVARVVGYSFLDCSGIETLSIPASVTNIGARAFAGCSSLKAFEVAEDNPAFISIDGVLFAKDGRTLLRFPPAKAGHYEIPDGVETVAAFAFEGCGRLSGLSFGADVKAVGTRAFDGCAFLAQVVFNYGLDRIGDYAFNGCSSLAALTIPESVTALGEGAFDGCDLLESLSLPENITVKPKNIGGKIRGNVSLYRGCIYNVTNSLIVMGGATLKIPAGVVLKMNDSWSSIVVCKGGRLVATGTRAAPVVFTSIRDDEFAGDTNGDGNSSRPQGGDWGDVHIQGEAELAYVRIRYGQPYHESGFVNVSNYEYYDDYYYYDYADEWTDLAYYADEARLTMDCCVVEHTTSDWGVGLYNNGGSVVARNCVFSDLPSALHGYGRYDDARSGYYYSYYTMAGQTNSFANCVFHGCDSVVQDNWYNIDTTAAVFDNCVFSEMVEWVGGYGDSIPSSLAFRNCCFWNPEDDEFYPVQTNNLVGVSGNIWDNPHFENADGGDFRIKSASPCVDAGRGENAPARDYYGQPRNGAPDIGIYEVQIRPLGDTDLAALAVSGDMEAEIGGSITVSWTVGNVGTEDAAEEWRDVLELVDSSGRAVELGSHLAIGGLASGGNLTFTATYAVPSMSPGTARLRLKVNPYRDIYEGSFTANNVCLAGDTVEIVLPAFDAATDSDIALRSGGSVALRVPAGSGTTAFRIAGKAAAGSTTGGGVATISAYALAGGVPAGLRYDVAAVALADGSLLLVLPEDADETDYNVSVFNDGLSAAEVELTPLADALSVLEVAPERLANRGEGHLTVLGIGMDCVGGIRLEGPAAIAATEFRAASPAELAATFDLSGAAVGSYALVLVDKEGLSHSTGKTVEVYNPKIGPRLEAWLELPSSTRQGRVYTGRICYANTGDEDMAAPCLSLSVESALVGLDFDEISFTKLDVLAIGAVAPQGMLKAGEENYIGLWFKSGAEPRFSLDKLSGTSDEWKQAAAAMSEAASVLNPRGRPAVLLESLQPYVEAVEEGEGNTAAICGHVIASDEVTSAITVVAETEDGQYVASDEVDENGVFILDGLANATNYVVKVSGGAVAEAVSVEMPPSGDRVGLMIAATAKRTLTISVEGVPEGEEPKGAYVLYNDDAEEIASGEFFKTWKVDYASTNAEDVVYIKCTLESGREASKCSVVSPYDPDFGMDTFVDFSDSSLLKGFVTMESGSAATGAIVRVRSQDYEIERAVIVSDGSYAIGGLYPDFYYVDAIYEGVVSKAVEVAIVEGGDSEENLILPCSDTVPLSVNIFNNPDSAILKIENKDSDFSRTYFVSNGLFNVEGLAKGRCEIGLFDLNGFALTTPSCVNVDEKTTINLSPSATVFISGILKSDEGGGIHGVISLIPSTGERYVLETDENGVFGTSVPIGHYWLEGKAPGYESVSTFIGLDVESSLVITLNKRAIDNDEIDDDEISYDGMTLTGEFYGSRKATIEFIGTDDEIIAITQLDVPCGKYSISNAPCDFAYVWLSDSHGTGILKSREEFFNEDCAVNMSCLDLTPVDICVYADDEKTIPIHGATIWMTGVHSNIVLSTTDLGGHARFLLSQGQYVFSAFRMMSAEGKVVELEIFGSEGFSKDYVFAEACETANPTWLTKTNVKPLMSLVKRSRSFAKGEKSEKALQANADSSIIQQVKNVINQVLQMVLSYSKQAEAMIKEPPTLECKHNLDIWKKYRVARIKFDGAKLNISYDVSLLQNALTRLGIMIAYKVPGYVPGVGLVWSGSTTVTEMVKDGASKKERNDTADKMKLGIVSAQNSLQMDDYVNLPEEVVNNNAKISKNNETIELEKWKARSNEKALNDPRISKKDAKKLKEAYDKNLKKVADLEAENAKLVAANKKLSGAGKFVDDARLLKKTNWSKAAKAGKIGGKIAGGALTGLSVYLDIKELQPYAEEAVRYLGCLAIDLSDLASAFEALAAAYRTPYHDHQTIGGTNNVCLVERICPTSTNRMDEASLNVRVSSDPNEIVGPLGVGDAETERFVKPGQELTYTIYFENKADAQTAAQEIRVAESLDPALDWSTFRLGEVAFNNQIDNNLSGKTEGVSEVKMNGTNYYVRTEASCDAATGKVSWYLRIVDKTTTDEWPTDIDAGILPPNDETFRGEGHLTYRVNVRNDVEPGTRSAASAIIKFDYNDDIPTDPSWWNIVGRVKSVSLANGDESSDVRFIVGAPYGKDLPDAPAGGTQGLVFAGWFTGPNGTGRKVTSESIVEEGDSALYAYWTRAGGSGTLELNLNAGWNLVSFNVLPDDASPEAVFGAVAESIGRVVGGSRSWSPERGGNLRSLAVGTGYWVQAKESGVALSVAGAGNPYAEIPLKAGWTLVGYPLQEARPLEDALATAIADGQIDRVVRGSQNWRSGRGGTLSTLSPGLGYWVHATEATTITFDND